MILEWIYLCSLYLVLFVIIPLDAYPSTGPSCVKSCENKVDGYYDSCTSCSSFIKCHNRVTMVVACPGWQEFDSVVTGCINGRSSTCVIHSIDDSREATTESEIEIRTTTVSTKRDIPTTVTVPATVYPTSWISSLYPSVSTDDIIESYNTKTKDERSQYNTSSNNGTNSPCTNTETGIECKYLIIISAVGGFCSFVPFFLFWNCCVERKKKVVTNFTQTRNQREHLYSREPMYDEISTTTGNSDATYQPMPYAVSNYRQYQTIQSPTYESAVDEGNVYLELHGYNYLQTQDLEIRKEIDKTLAPVVVQLCHKYKTEPTEYQAVLQKLNDIFDKGSNGKTALQMVIDDLYSGSKNSNYLVPRNW